MYSDPMSSRSVQISLDRDLLAEVDRQPETRQQGRSAVIRRALRLYLDLKKRREIDAAYEQAYVGRADELLEEFGELIGAQAWPEA